MENLNDIYGEIKSDPENAKYSAKNIDPLYYCLLYTSDAADDLGAV